MSTPSVGQDIEDYCGRCGDTWHVVMAKVGDRVAKVVCKLCGGQHNYRNEKTSAANAATGKAANTRRTTAKRKTATPPPQVTDPSIPPRKYSGQETYRAGERIDHPIFGIGVVRGSPGDGKVAVAFPIGERVLACAKVRSSLERPVPVALTHVADRPPDKH